MAVAVATAAGNPVKRGERGLAPPLLAALDVELAPGQRLLDIGAGWDHARTLRAGSAALERQLDAARLFTSDAAVRAYRLYLAGSAMCFERGWLSLYQLPPARPGPGIGQPGLPGAASDYPINRACMDT